MRKQTFKDYILPVLKVMADGEARKNEIYFIKEAKYAKL